METSDMLIVYPNHWTRFHMFVFFLPHIDRNFVHGGVTHLNSDMNILKYYIIRITFLHHFHQS